MDLTFDNIFNLINDSLFQSPTMTGLALLIVAWAVCAVICIYMKASPAYTVVPMIPLAIFFAAKGILSELVTIVIVLVSAVLVALAAKQAVD